MEGEAFTLAAPARFDASMAFSAADIASKATAAVLMAHGATADALASKLVSADKEMWDRIATVHRLNEHFAAAGSFAAAEVLAGTLATKCPALGKALVDLLSNGDALVELVVQLMHSLCLHADGAALMVQAGALPVLAAMLRADEPLVRSHGLALLATLSERPSLATALTKAGVLKLVTFLAKSGLPPKDSAEEEDADAAKARAASLQATWPLLLEIADGLLRTPTAVVPFQRQKLRDVLAQAAFAHKAGRLPLELPDGRRLTRLMITLRALALADPPPGQRAPARTHQVVGVR